MESLFLGLNIPGLGEIDLGPDVETLLKLADSDFQTKEVWASLRAVANLGEQVEVYLRETFGEDVRPKPAAVASEHDHQSHREIAADIRAHLAEGSKPKAGAEPGAAAPKPEMNPFLMALLMTLAKQALLSLVDRLRKPKEIVNIG